MSLWFNSPVLRSIFGRATVNLILSVAVLVVTLALVLTRPRGLNEAYGAAIGAAFTLLLRLATPGDVGGVLRETGNVLLFLFGMMIVTGVVEAAGVFDTLAHIMAQRFGTSGRGLLIGVFLLGALVTAFLSLDVTIIVLTPIVFVATQRLRVDPVPHLFAVAFVANTASLFLPISNLTNILMYDLLHLPFAHFAAVMFLPNLAALAVNIAVFLVIFRHRLPRTIDLSTLTAPERPPLFTIAAVGLGTVLIALLGFGLKGWPLAIPACIGAVVLAVIALIQRAMAPRKIVASVTFSVFPFIVAMFTVIRGIEHAWLPLLQGIPTAQSLPNLLAIALGTTVGANLVNNVPMVAAAISVLRATATPVPPALAYAVLVGTNIGPSILPVGSLATLLWLALVARRDVPITGRDYLRVGLLTTPAMVLVTTLTLWLVLHFAR